MGHQNVATRIFTALVISMGLTVLTASLVQWGSRDPAEFATYFLLAVLSACWKENLPAYPGTISVGSLFVLVGFLQFGLLETLVMGCSALLVQAVFDHRGNHSPVALLFRVSNLAIAITAGHYVFHAATSSAAGRFWALIAATVAFGLMNTFPAAAVKAFDEHRGIAEVWHECSFWTMPYYVLSALAAAAISVVSGSVGWKVALGLLPLIYLVFRGANRYLDAAKAHQAGTAEMALIHQRTLEALGLAIEARFRATGEELARTHAYACGIAEELGMEPAEREALRIAASLHDIGALAIPEQILAKRSRLTAEEYEKVKTHAIVGESILRRAEFPFPAAQIVRSHHERWDGKGYPDRLQGTEIPMGARILAVVDSLVALTSDRPYRRAVPFREALAYIVSQSGKAFSPEIVAIVLRRADEFERLARGNSQKQPAAATDEDFISTISAARRESQEILELAQALGRSLSLNETLSMLATRLRRMVRYDCLAVYILRDQVLVPEYVTGTEHPSFFALEIPLGHGVSGKAAASGVPVRNGSPRDEFPRRGAATPRTRLRSALAVPLGANKKVAGVLTLYRKQPAAFQNDDVRILLGVHIQLAAAIENALRLKQAEDSATTDELTGLANARSLFLHLETELARCRRTGGPLTIALCDLDGFKAVNDRFGHLRGNKVLRAVGRVLKQSCREYDYVARMGGDEFVLVLPGLEATGVSRKIRHLEAAVIEAADRACPGADIRMSTGIARYQEDGEDAEALLAAADERMYEAKRRRKWQQPVRGYDFDRTAAGVP